MSSCNLYSWHFKETSPITASNVLFRVVSHKLRDQIPWVQRPCVSSSYSAQWNKLKKGTSIWQMWWPWLSFCWEEALLHLHDALRKIAWNFSETFTAAVHDVVVASAAGWTHCKLRDARPRLRKHWTCRKQQHTFDCHSAFFSIFTEDL